MGDERPTITFTIERDNGEKIEFSQQPVDLFAEHPSFAAPFYCAIGKLVIQSGNVEHQLSMGVSMCRKLDSERPVTGSKIVSASRKIKGIQEALKNGRLFGQTSDDPMWSAFLKAAADISKERNDVVHGVVVGFEEGPPSRIRLSYQDFDDPNSQPRESAYTLLELQDIIPKMQEIHLGLASLNVVLSMDYIIRFHEGPFHQTGIAPGKQT